MTSQTKLLFTPLSALCLLTSLPQASFSQNNTKAMLATKPSQFVYASDSGDENWDDRFGQRNILYGDILAIIALNDDLYIGGDFPGQKSIAKWTGDYWSPLGGGVDQNSGVSAFAVIENDLYVGGAFATVGNVPAHNIAKWSLSTQTWSAVESEGYNGVNRSVLAMAVDGDNLYVAGTFSAAGNISANRIVKWSPTNATWTALGDGLNDRVYDIAVRANEVYVGGAFTLADSIPVNYVAKWNGEAWAALGAGVNHVVNALSFYDNELYVGGYFTKAGDADANYVAKYNIATNNWSPLRAETDTSNGVRQISGASANVFAIAANTRGVYIGGTFDMVGEQNANRIVRWNPVSNTWSSLGSGVNGQVFAVMATENEVHVGGTFRYAGGKPSNRFAIWHESAKHAPLWSPLPNLTFGEDGRNRLELPKYISDVDDSLAALRFNAEVLGKQGAGGKWQKTSALQVTINPTTKIANFKASPDSFGVFKVAFMVADPGGLADTTTMQVRVNPRNDAPRFANLPATITFRNNTAKRLALWDFVSDPEDADSALHFSFSASKDSLKRAFNDKTGMLTLTAPGFIGKAQLFITVSDDSNAVARDTIAVQVDFSTGVAESNSEIPTEFVLLQNYPNPFSANGTFGNPTTLIRFGLPSASEVKLEVFDLSGQSVATLLNERKPAGFHAVEFNAAGLSSGTYFYRITAGSFGERKKLLLVK